MNTSYQNLLIQDPFSQKKIVNPQIINLQTFYIPNNL